MSTKISYFHAQERLSRVAPYLTIEESTYSTIKQKCKIFDSRVGEYFLCSPSMIIHGKQKGHYKASMFTKKYTIEQAQERLGDNFKIVVFNGWKENCEIIYIPKNEMMFIRPDDIINKKIIGTKSDRVDRRHITSIRKYGAKTNFKKARATNLIRYGYEFPAQSIQVQIKASKSVNKRVLKTHWKTGEELVCVGGYEAKCVDYFNYNSIDFHWQPMGFNCSNGKVYFIDCYLPEQDRYIEIKGYFRDDSKLKFDEFCSVYPKTELWNKEKLKQLKIL